MRTRIDGKTAGLSLTFLLWAAIASAQTPSSVTSKMLDQAWSRIQQNAATALSAAKDTQSKTKIYEDLFKQLIGDRDVAMRLDEAYYATEFEKLVREIPDAALAKSVSAPLSNPGATGLVERSGFTDLLALSADLQQLFSSNDSAISINLNALALVAGGREGAFSAPYLYRKHDALRRLGGTLTFGAKIPDGEITGFTGLPDADTLLDVFVWDVKYRLVGDRDPRSARWYPLLLGRMGDVVNFAARVPTLPSVPVTDVSAVRDAANKILGMELGEARKTINSSLQISAKISGQHLTKEAGKNKFVTAAMLDKGFAGVDLTANLAYNVVDQPQPGATDPFKVKEWQVNAGLFGSVLEGVIAADRSAEVSASLSAKLPVSDRAVPIDRKNVWKFNVTLTLPFQKSAKIPISFTYSNDPNNLKKEKYVTGRIGFSYDFGSLFKTLASVAPKK